MFIGLTIVFIFLSGVLLMYLIDTFSNPNTYIIHNSELINLVIVKTITGILFLISFYTFVKITIVFITIINKAYENIKLK